MRLRTGVGVLVLATGCCPEERPIEQGRACDTPSTEYYCASDPPPEGEGDYAYSCVNGRWVKWDEEGYGWAPCIREDGECAYVEGVYAE